MGCWHRVHVDAFQGKERNSITESSLNTTLRIPVHSFPARPPFRMSPESVDQCGRGRLAGKTGSGRNLRAEERRNNGKESWSIPYCFQSPRS